MFRSLAALSSVLFFALSDSAAFAEPQYTVRLGIGGGATIAPVEARRGLFEVAPRASITWGDAEESFFRGFEGELRLANFSVEPSLGFVVGRGFDHETGIQASLCGGYALRTNGVPTPTVSFRIAAGLRHDERGWVRTDFVYLSARRAFLSPEEFQLTAGVEIGLALLDAVLRLSRI